MCYLGYSQDFLMSLYEKMLRIRRFEETAADLKERGEVSGNIHPCIGEEGSVVGACAALRDTDYITSTHRGHGHCLAKGARTDLALAELWGRSLGYCKGKGGSLHIVDVSKGILGANGIVGAGIPIATGSGMTSKIRGTDDVTVCFFGDGASNQGTFHESINMASAWKLPVVYFCENNGWGVSVPIEKITNVTDLSQRAVGYGIPGEVVDGMDVLAVYEATKRAVERARKGEGPSIIESKTYLFRGHYCGDPGDYRPAEYYQKAHEKDPVFCFRAKLLSAGIGERELAEIDDKIEKEIHDAVIFASSAPYPDVAEALTDVYSVDNERSVCR